MNESIEQMNLRIKCLELEIEKLKLEIQVLQMQKPEPIYVPQPYPVYPQNPWWERPFYWQYPQITCGHDGNSTMTGMLTVQM